VVELSNSDVTSDSRRHLEAEMDKTQLMINEKTHIICERYAIDLKLVLNTDRKPWPLYRQVTSLPVCDVTELVKLNLKCESG
jgi:hypothetical protein